MNEWLPQSDSRQDILWLDFEPPQCRLRRGGGVVKNYLIVMQDNEVIYSSG